MRILWSNPGEAHVIALIGVLVGILISAIVNNVEEGRRPPL